MITLTDSRYQVVAGAGQTVFTLNFVFENASDVKGYANTTLLDPSTYTVTGAGLDSTITSRYVTLNSGATAGVVYTFMRDASLERVTDFTNAPDFNATNIDNEFDRLVLMIQQLNTKLTQLGLQYPNYVDDSTGISINALPKLPANTGEINVWSTDSEGNLIAASIEENPDVSTLRSELAAATSSASGASLVGHYNSSGLATTVNAQLLTLEAATISGFSTGMCLPFFGLTSVVPSGWLYCDDGTIGNASSGATNRANADTEALFTQLWNIHGTDTKAAYLQIYDSVGAPASRGASAAADFAANKRLSLPLIQNKTIASIQTAARFSTTFTTDYASNSLLTLALVGFTDVRDAFPFGCAVQVSSTGTLPTGLLPATTYYVIAENDSTIYLANSLANSTPNSTTPIVLTSDGSAGAVHTITKVLQPANTFQQGWTASWHGEMMHSTRVSEIPAHAHEYSTPLTVNYATLHNVPGFVDQITTATTEATGGNLPINIMQPTIYAPWIIKL